MASRLQAFGAALDVVGEEDVPARGYVLLVLDLDRIRLPSPSGRTPAIA